MLACFPALFGGVPLCARPAGTNISKVRSITQTTVFLLICYLPENCRLTVFINLSFQRCLCTTGSRAASQFWGFPRLLPVFCLLCRQFAGDIIFADVCDVRDRQQNRDRWLGVGLQQSTWTDVALGYCCDEYGSDTGRTDRYSNPLRVVRAQVPPLSG